ncbi:hypothetical protein ACTFIR_012082 [Dictyostelium discoideum]
MDNNSSIEGFKLEKLPFQYFSITELLKVKDEPYTWITEDGCRIIKHFLIINETLVVVEYKIDSRSNHTTIFKLPNFDMVDLKYSSSFITEENIKRWGPTDHKLDKNRWADGDSINIIIDFINLQFNIENLVNHSTYHHLLLKNFNEENKNKLNTFRLCNIPLNANGNHWCLLTFKNLNNGFFQPVLINSLNGHPDIVGTVLNHYKRLGFKFNDLLVINFLNRLTINEEDYIFKINNQNINKLEEKFYKLYCGKSKAITQEIINIWRSLLWADDRQPLPSANLPSAVCRLPSANLPVCRLPTCRLPSANQPVLSGLLWADDRQPLPSANQPVLSGLLWADGRQPPAIRPIPSIL